MELLIYIYIYFLTLINIFKKYLHAIINRI